MLTAVVLTQRPALIPSSSSVVVSTLLFDPNALFPLTSRSSPKVYLGRFRITRSFRTMSSRVGGGQGSRRGAGGGGPSLRTTIPKVPFSTPIHPCNGVSLQSTNGNEIDISNRDVLQIKVPIKDHFMLGDRSGTLGDLKDDNAMDNATRKGVFLLMWLSQQLMDRCKVNVFIERVLTKDSTWTIQKGGSSVHMLPDQETAYLRYRLSFCLKATNEEKDGSVAEHKASSTRGAGNVGRDGCIEIGRCVRQMMTTLLRVDDRHYSAPGGAAAAAARRGGSMTREQMLAEGGGGGGNEDRPGSRFDPYRSKQMRDAVRRSLPVSDYAQLFNIIGLYSSTTMTPDQKTKIVESQSDSDIGELIASCFSIERSISRSDSHASQCVVDSKRFGRPELVYGLSDTREFAPPYNNIDDPTAPSGFDRFHPWLHPPQVDKDKLEAYLEEQKKASVKTKWHFTQTWLYHLAKNRSVDCNTDWLVEEFKRHDLDVDLIQDIFTRKPLLDEKEGRATNELAGAETMPSTVESFWLAPLHLHATEAELDRWNAHPDQQHDEQQSTKTNNTAILEKLYAIAVVRSKAPELAKTGSSGARHAIREGDDEATIQARNIAATRRLHQAYERDLDNGMLDISERTGLTAKEQHEAVDKMRKETTKIYHGRLRELQQAGCRATYHWFIHGNRRPPAIVAIAEFIQQRLMAHDNVHRNLSVPMPCLAPNLIPFASFVAWMLYWLEHTCDESYLHMHIILLWLDVLSTYDIGCSTMAFQLRQHRWFEGLPSGGKSHMLHACLQKCIAGTYNLLQDFSEKSFKPDNEEEGLDCNRFDRLVLAMDDVSRKSFGDIVAKYGLQNNKKTGFVEGPAPTNSLGEALQKMNMSRHRAESVPSPAVTAFQQAMTYGSISYTRLLRDAETGRQITQYSTNLLRFLAIVCVNFSNETLEALNTRMDNNVIDSRSRPGNDPADKANGKSNNPERHHKKQMGELRLRSMQALAALTFSCIATDSILPIQETIADQLLGEFFKEAGLTADVGGPTPRAQSHIRSRMRAYCVAEAILKVFNDPAVDLYWNKPFEPEQLVDLQPYLVVSVDHFVFAMTAMMERFYHPLIPAVARTLREEHFTTEAYRTDLAERQACGDAVDPFSEDELKLRFKGRYFVYKDINAGADDVDAKGMEDEEKSRFRFEDMNRLNADYVLDTDGLEDVTHLRLLAIMLTNALNASTGVDNVQYSDMEECLSQLTKMKVESLCPMTKTKKIYPLLVIFPIAEAGDKAAQITQHIINHWQAVDEYNAHTKNVDQHKTYDFSKDLLVQDKQTGKWSRNENTKAKFARIMKRYRVIRIVVFKSLIVSRGNPFEDAMQRVVAKAMDRSRTVMTGMMTGTVPYIARMMDIKADVQALGDHIMTVRNPDYMNEKHHRILSAMTDGFIDSNNMKDAERRSTATSHTDLHEFGLKGTETFTILQRNEKLFIGKDENERFKGRTSSAYLSLIEKKKDCVASEEDYPINLVPETGVDGRRLLNRIRQEQDAGFTGMIGHAPFVSREDEIPDKDKARKVVLDLNAVQGATNLSDLAFLQPGRGYESIDPSVRMITAMKRRIFGDSSDEQKHKKEPPAKTPGRGGSRHLVDDDYLSVGLFSQMGGEAEENQELQDRAQRQLLKKRKAIQSLTEQKEQEDAEGPLLKGSSSNEKTPQRRTRQKTTHYRQPQLPEAYRAPIGMITPPRLPRVSDARMEVSDEPVEWMQS
jgi:hypothetical protein